MFSLRSTRISEFLLVVFLVSATSLGHAQINPNQIDWPTGTAGCLYAPGTNTCVPGGLTGSVYQPLLNILDYGAVGNGTTDNCTALTNALAAVPSTGAQILIPTGNFHVGPTCSLTVTNQTDFIGMGICDNHLVGCISEISTVRTSTPLFTVNAQNAHFYNVAIVNVPTSFPTADAGVYVTSSNKDQRVDFDHVMIAGFYDDLHVGVGQSWIMRDSFLLNAYHRCGWIENTVSGDSGDWRVENTLCTPGQGSLTAESAFYVTSSGGMRWGPNNKIVFNLDDRATQFTNGVEINSSSSTVQASIFDSSIEQVSAKPIWIAASWPYIAVTNNSITAPAGLPCIYATNVNGMLIAGNICSDNYTTGAGYAFQFTGTSARVTIGPNVNFFTTGMQTGLTTPNTNSSPFNYDLSGAPTVQSLTTTGTSGPATLSGGVLNIPQYAGGGGGSGAWTNITGTVTASGCTVSSGSCGVSGSSTTTISFSSIPGTYNRLQLVAWGQASSAGSTLAVNLNGDTSAHYSTNGSYQAGSANPLNGNSQSVTSCGLAVFTTGVVSSMAFEIPFYANTSFGKGILSHSAGIGDVTNQTLNDDLTNSCGWNQTAAVTSVSFTISTGYLAAGTQFMILGQN